MATWHACVGFEAVRGDAEEPESEEDSGSDYDVHVVERLKD